MATKKVKISELNHIVEQIIKEQNIVEANGGPVHQAFVKSNISDEGIYTLRINNKFPDDPGLDKLPAMKVVNQKGGVILDYIEKLTYRNKNLTVNITKGNGTGKNDPILTVNLRDDNVNNEDVITFEILNKYI